MIIGLQLVGILFGLIMLYFSYLHFRRNEFDTTEFFVWTFVWGAFILTSAFPSYLAVLSEALSVSSLLDFLIIVALFFTIALTFHNFSILKKNQRKLETTVRQLALERKK